MEDEIKKEIAGGVEFQQETPIESVMTTEVAPPTEETEIAGGVEFSKTPVKNIHPKHTPKEAQQEVRHRARTMAQDLGEQIIEKQGALLQGVLKDEREKKEKRKQEQKNIIFGLVSVVLCAAAIGIIMYGSKGSEEIVIPQTQVVQPSIIYAENHSRLDTTNKESLTILQTIKDKIKNTEADLGEITNIYFTRETPAGVATLTGRQFFSSVQSSIPGNFLGTLEREFMFGVHTKDKNGHFLILQGDRKEGLPVLIAWEVDMVREISQLFSIEIQDASLYTKPFVEHSIENKTLRTLFNEDDQFILGYGYIGEKTLIIVDDIETFKKVLQRLATAF